MFSERDLDTVLYGYLRPAYDPLNAMSPGHALSGLRVEQLSYGQYRPSCPHHPQLIQVTEDLGRDAHVPLSDVCR